MSSRHRCVSSIAISLAIGALALGLAAGAAVAQSAPESGPEADAAAISSPRTRPGYTVPRLAIGQPDLQGAWSNASITGLARPSEFKTLVLTDEQAMASAAANPLVVRQQTDDAGSTLTQQDGKDLNSGRGYNAFWISPGTAFGQVKDTWRTSWIVEPSNGQMPMSAEGRKLIAAKSPRGRGTGYDHPEERSLGERCIISFAGNGGPVLMNSQYYNDNYRIVQSPTHVMIDVEMNHDARIIPLFASAEAARAARSPEAIRPWLGEAVGWWEGDTLVAETTKFHPGQFGAGRISVSETGRVTERFTRYSEDQILYEFEVDDPALYTQVWKGEMSLNMLTGETGDVYEYACHEGNYGISGILAGGRKNDRDGVGNGAAGDRDDG
jgi:hypothetical protein